jgi:hypothetical protein
MNPRDIIGSVEVRKMCGRAFHENRKPITRPTLRLWRAKRAFPQPLDAPKAGVELWMRPEVRAWIRDNLET